MTCFLDREILFWLWYLETQLVNRVNMAQLQREGAPLSHDSTFQTLVERANEKMKHESLEESAAEQASPCKNRFCLQTPLFPFDNNDRRQHG